MTKPLMSKGLILALAVAGLAACAKPAAKAAASGSDQTASSTAAVHWDTASNDPSKNMIAANKEAATPGYIP